MTKTKRKQVIPIFLFFNHALSKNSIIHWNRFNMIPFVKCQIDVIDIIDHNIPFILST